jgi:hypothetical protein
MRDTSARLPLEIDDTRDSVVMIGHARIHLAIELFPRRWAPAAIIIP